MRALFIWLILAGAASAQSVVPTRTIRANSVISASDVALRQTATLGEIYAIHQVVGREARVTLYAGRAISDSELAEPSLIERNQIVELSFLSNGLSIQAEGRALARAGLGERIRVMNLASKTVVTGIVQADGTVALGLQK